ncbi:MAG: hypothetical protein FGM37_09680, partial [Phycisphaerales bacterium]|nr:hypothetical protein [Phycisphaerales bacterium]
MRCVTARLARSVRPWRVHSIHAMGQLTGLLGIAVLLLVALALSSDRRRISMRTVAVGVLAQFALAYLMLRFPPVSVPFDAIAALVARVISFADEGTRFIFGNAADAGGPWGFIFAVQVLPIIIFFASLMAVLY